MATTRQIQANRKNAQNSTGPRSVEGKAVARFNALKSGIDAKSLIIDGENPKELEALTSAFYDRFNPVGIDQIGLVDTLIHSEWLLRRLRKAESQLWDYAAASTWELDDNNPLGQIAQSNADGFSRLQRRLDSVARTRERALDQLRRLQKDQPPAPQLLEPVATSTEIGFVPSTTLREPDQDPIAQPPAARTRPVQLERQDLFAHRIEIQAPLLHVRDISQV